ncbi:TPA: restriction endonuclease subunit S [Neisseria subflava]
MNKQQEPRLRFKGFTGAWEEKVLGEVTEYLSDGTHFSPKSQNGEYKYITSKNIRNSGLDLSDVSYISAEEHQEIYKRCSVKFGDLLLTKDGASTGNCCINFLDEEFSLLSSVAVLRPKQKKHNANFLCQVLQSPIGQNEIKGSMAGQAITRITLEKLRAYKFNFPLYEEQTHLGLFFRRLDSQIAESRAVLEKNHQLKKAMLAKMFPANGEKIPKIRFKGFEGGWKREILKDVVNVFDNLRIPVSENKRTSGNTPYFGANGIQDYVDGFTHNGEFVLIAEDGANDLKNYPVQYVNGKCWVNNHAHVLQGKSEILNNIFLFSRFQSMDISQFLVGGGRAKLNGSTMLEIEIEFPKDKKEQTAIGLFFRQLDETIALQTAEVEKLNQLKKGLLAAMLV